MLQRHTPGIKAVFTAGVLSVMLPVTVQSALEEVTVTAQKRTESVQEVPISISAFTGEALSDYQVVDLISLNGAAPNVQIQHFSNTPHGAVFNIRGMGVVEPDPYAGQTVTTVVDGVPLVFNMLSLLDLYDVERIEIHRGPQGTLFGANTTGGVINVITRQPTGEWGGDLKATVGNWDRVDVKGTINFPISDVLAGKITAQHHQRDGWHRNVVNGDTMGDVEISAFRGYLKFEPNDTFDGTFIGEYVRSRNGSPIVVNGSFPGEVTGVPAGASPGPGLGVMYQGPCLVPNQRCEAPDKYLSANNSVRDISDQDVYSATLTMNWDVAFGKFTSITGVKDFELYEETDQDGTPFFIDDTRRPTEGTQFSQEIRLDSKPFDRIEIISGFFYQYNEWNHQQNFRIPFAGPLNQVTDMDWENWSASLFAHTFFDITDQLRGQFGVRWSQEETSADALITTFANPAPGGTALFTGGVQVGQFGNKDTEIWRNWAAKAGLDYQWNDEVMIYGFFSRGFKSGGFTGRLGVPEDLGPYNPEFVETAEFGIKSEWFDNRLRFNASAFYNWYDDLQLALIFFCTDQQTGATINCNSIINAASAETKGLEFEVQAVPTDGLTVTANLGYLDAEYTDFPFLDPATNQVVQLAGSRLQNAAEWTANIGVTYDFPVFSGMGTVGAKYSYVSDKFLGNLQNTPRSEIQPTHYVDANAKWQPPSERWAVSAWVLNIADERYIDSVFEAAGFIGLMSYGPPRQWGVSFEYFWD